MPKSILKSILVSIDRPSDGTPAMELAIGWAERSEAELVSVGFIDEYSIEVAHEYTDKEGLIPAVNPPLIARVQQDYKRFLEKCATTTPASDRPARSMPRLSRFSRPTRKSTSSVR
jgi:hypothetical protein